jgi:putative membrane protein
MRTRTTRVPIIPLPVTRLPIVAVLVAVVCVVLAAPGVAMAATSPAPGGAGSASPVSARDKAFLSAAARGAQFEVASGRLAVDRAGDPRIREFGNRMITDHGQELQRLQALGRSLGVAPPAALGKDQQAVMAIWSSIRGGSFDCSYAPTMQADHEADLGMYAAVSRYADNPQVRQFAKAQVPVLHQHLNQATRNLTGLNCSAPPLPPPTARTS